LPRRKSSEQSLTPLELEIMNVLWETGPANVQTVQSRIQGRELAYTTVQTMLNVLYRKGRVRRQLKDRAYVYRPILSRQKAIKQAVGDMLDRFFGGSADSLVLNLVETRHLTPEKLAQIQALLARRLEKHYGTD
jgi:BlaI family penicillinase repressor